jgi:hypothetical protein
MTVALPSPELDASVASVFTMYSSSGPVLHREIVDKIQLNSTEQSAQLWTRENLATFEGLTFARI